MKQVLAAIMVTALGAQALPALAGTPLTRVSVPADVEMPFTDRFASALTRYRNCVLRQVDNQVLSTPENMASEALSACALSRAEVQQQLAEDIRTHNPHHPRHVALSSAEQAMTSVDPMITQVAVERAHVAFARVMF